MKNNTKIRLHLSKQLFESLTKQVIAEAKGKHYGAGMEEVKAPKAKKAKVEEMETRVAETPDEKKVTITLDEFTGSPFALEVGQWVADNWPTVAKALDSSVADDPAQRLVDLGTMVIGLATVGSAAVSVGLAVAKDDIKAAAKKLRDKVKGMVGSKGAVSEGDEDQELADIVAKMPEDIKAKIASK